MFRVEHTTHTHTHASTRMDDTGEQSCHTNQAYNKHSISSVSFSTNFWYSSESKGSTSLDVMDNLFIHIIYFVVFSLFLFITCNAICMQHACFVNSCKYSTGFSVSAFGVPYPSAITAHTSPMYILNSILFPFDTQNEIRKNTHLCEFFRFILDGWKRLKNEFHSENSFDAV